MVSILQTANTLYRSTELEVCDFNSGLCFHHSTAIVNRTKATIGSASFTNNVSPLAHKIKNLSLEKAEEGKKKKKVMGTGEERGDGRTN